MITPFKCVCQSVSNHCHMRLLICFETLAHAQVIQYTFLDGTSTNQNAAQDISFQVREVCLVGCPRTCQHYKEMCGTLAAMETITL